MCEYWHFGGNLIFVDAQNTSKKSTPKIMPLLSDLNAYFDGCITDVFVVPSQVGGDPFPMFLKTLLCDGEWLRQDSEYVVRILRDVSCNEKLTAELSKYFGSAILYSHCVMVMEPWQKGLTQTSMSISKMAITPVTQLFVLCSTEKKTAGKNIGTFINQRKSIDRLVSLFLPAENWYRNKMSVSIVL